MKNSIEQYASPPKDKRNQSVLSHVLRNIAERNIRCLTIKIEMRGDLQKKTRVLIAPIYQNMLYQCADSSIVCESCRIVGRPASMIRAELTELCIAALHCCWTEEPSDFSSPMDHHAQ